VATFFVAQNATESKDIAVKYGADYVLVLYADDLRKFSAIILGSGESPDDYINQSFDPKDSELGLKVQTIGTELINGKEEVDGFEKAFDSGKVRIYRVLH